MLFLHLTSNLHWTNINLAVIVCQVPGTGSQLRVKLTEISALVEERHTVPYGECYREKKQERRLVVAVQNTLIRSNIKISILNVHPQKNG